MTTKTIKTYQDVVDLAKANNCQWIDLKFVDLPGLWQHFSIPLSYLDEDMFTEGVGFDGSSIRGFQKINESDMLLVLDPATAIVDPACDVPTLSIVCDVKDPITGKSYSRDPRFVAKKAEAYLKASGLGDVSYWGPELEFFIFNSIRFEQNSHEGFYHIDSEEGIWNSGNHIDGGNQGYHIRTKEGYFPVPPSDKQQDLRSEMGDALIKSGIDVEVHHHEVATAGQAEFSMRFDSLVNMADKTLLYKYICKNVADKQGYTVTFMPKPLFQDNGSGMHTHQSVWKDNKNLFFDAKGYGLISDFAQNYIGGLLKHSPALLAFCAPSTNSYRRLVPGYEAPINLVFSQRNRSASVRIPMYSRSSKSKRIEYRCPDATCNPYLAFSAMLMAGLDGVRNKIDPGKPIDEDIYELPPEEKARIKSTPGSLAESLNALEKDHKFLLEGGVFTPDLVNNWITYKKKNEVDAVALRPHPYEFHLYYDI